VPRIGSDGWGRPSQKFLGARGEEAREREVKSDLKNKPLFFATLLPFFSFHG
jgi:hypothetical protein